MILCFVDLALYYSLEDGKLHRLSEISVDDFTRASDATFREATNITSKQFELQKTNKFPVELTEFITN